MGQHIVDLGKRALGRLDLVAAHGELAKRCEEAGQQRLQRHQHADTDPAVHDLPGADADHRCGSDGDQHLLCRLQERALALKVAEYRLLARLQAEQPLDQQRLGAVGAHLVDAGEALGAGAREPHAFDGERNVLLGGPAVCELQQSQVADADRERDAAEQGVVTHHHQREEQ